MSVCRRGSVWKQASVSQSVRKQPVYACQPVVIVQSGNKPLSVSPSKMKPVYAYQPVVIVQSGNKPLPVSPLESSLYTHVSLLSLCSLETSHCQSVRKQPVCTCQYVAMVQSGNEPLSVCPRAACVYMSVCCHGAVWKQATVSERRPPVVLISMLIIQTKL